MPFGLSTLDVVSRLTAVSHRDARALEHHEASQTPDDPELAPVDQMRAYLDRVRASGLVNMFGVAPLVADRYGLSDGLAADVLKWWMVASHAPGTPSRDVLAQMLATGAREQRLHILRRLGHDTFRTLFGLASVAPEAAGELEEAPYTPEADAPAPELTQAPIDAVVEARPPRPDSPRRARRR